MPVLAAAPGESSGSSAVSKPPAPTTAEVAEFLRRQKEQQEWLKGSQAKAERKDSEEAYAEVSGNEARSILLEAFPEVLASMNEDPGRALTELEVEKPLGTYTALVGNGHGGERRLVESSVPIESEVGGEGKKPVDLTLERSGDGFEPANPLAELELPARAEGAVQLQEGLGVRLPTSDDHEAVPLGEENLFIPETEQSTDTLLSPVAGGVEISEQLRSKESPHRLAFELELPEGASLHATQNGGAEVLSENGKKIEEVPPPSAVDAQGSNVPVEMNVAGESLVLEVADPGESTFAYPILVDPWYITESANWGVWSADSPGGYGLRNLGSSISAYSESYRLYGPNTWSQWVYTAPGETAYVAAGYFNPVDFLVGSCYTAQPHGYVGIYNAYSSAYDALGIFSGGSSESVYETGWSGEPGDRYATIGIGDGNESVAIPCYHEIYVGGYLIQLADEDEPSWNSVESPSAWMNGLPKPIHVSATDRGLGMKSYELWSLNTKGEYEPQKVELTCSGTHQSPCPAAWETDLTAYTPLTLPTGRDKLYVAAEDPVENQSAIETVWVNVDHTGPEVGLSGSLATQGTLGMGKPEYVLKWQARDGSLATFQSGVKEVVVKVDGAVVHTETPSCSGT
ncbi:MAG TPA: hypothetical protein VGG40_06840, partial [Solirubrobacterales bacterium]